MICGEWTKPILKLWENPSKRASGQFSASSAVPAILAGSAMRDPSARRAYAQTYT